MNKFAEDVSKLVMEKLAIYADSWWLADKLKNHLTTKNQQWHADYNAGIDGIEKARAEMADRLSANPAGANQVRDVLQAAHTGAARNAVVDTAARDLDRRSTVARLQEIAARLHAKELQRASLTGVAPTQNAVDMLETLSKPFVGMNEVGSPENMRVLNRVAGEMPLGTRIGRSIANLGKLFGK